MRRRALCVGINNFKNRPDAQLQGCVNDANNMAGIFKSFLGFTDEDITVLTDDQATKANIMSNLQAMVDGAKSGAYDYLAFSLSSHGTQVPDLDGDEPDKADEAFCPHDLAATLHGEWDRDHIIVDDELHDLFATLPPNVLLEVYFDTCHSGTGLRALALAPGRKPRWLPPPSMKAFKEVEGRVSRGLSGRFWTKKSRTIFFGRRVGRIKPAQTLSLKKTTLGMALLLTTGASKCDRLKTKCLDRIC